MKYNYTAASALAGKKARNFCKYKLFWSLSEIVPTFLKTEDWNSAKDF